MSLILISVYNGCREYPYRLPHMFNVTDSENRLIIITMSSDRIDIWYSRQRIFFSPFLFFFFSPFFFFCYKIAWDSKFRSFFFFFFNYLYFFLAKQDPKLFEFPKNSCKEFFLFFTIAFLDSRPLILSLSLSFAHSLSLSRSLSLLALLNKQYL